jgi:hypothetical protein
MVSEIFPRKSLCERGEFAREWIDHSFPGRGFGKIYKAPYPDIPAIHSSN